MRETRDRELVRWLVGWTLGTETAVMKKREGKEWQAQVEDKLAATDFKEPPDLKIKLEEIDRSGTWSLVQASC